MREIALNYIYLSRNHAGGKDQVGLNLLKGFYANGDSKNMYVICYDYSVDVVKELAPDVEIIGIKSNKAKSELARMMTLCYTNTFIIPKIIKQYGIKLLYHLSCNTGLRKLKTISVVIPHDIKAVSHRVLANVKVPLYKYCLYKIMYEIDFATNDRIIAISDTDKGEISKFYPKYADKIERIYNPIDISLPVSYERKVGNYIVALNLQFHHKNIITLIKAFELIKDQIEENLILIGNVPKRVEYLKDYVKEHSLEDRVIFTGFVDEQKKQELFEGCKLYVNPTLYEGFGMTAVEALIAGIPTLISKIDTNYEVTKGLCEYYYPPEDEKELADKILSVLDKDLDLTMVFQISNNLFEEYNYLNIAQRYIAFFTSLLEVKK